MRKYIYSTINLVLKKIGLTLQKYEEKWERNAFAKLYESRIKYVPLSGIHPAECIVFSKDRALQLHALISSYLEKVASPVPIHILYHTSTPAHRKAYDEVRGLFLNSDVLFIRQDSDNSFRSNLITLLTSVHSEKVFFLVDDVIFVEDFDVKDFTKFDTDKFVPTLRMGMNLKKCYTVQEGQPLPELMPDIIKDKDKITWQWDQGAHDWSYPLSLDGHFFFTQEIATMIQSTEFSAPNTLEDQLQKFRRFFLFRKGVAYKKSRIVNIPCNKVQTENRNLYGNIHQDYLLDQWEKGFQMDYRSLYGFMNESAHQEIFFKFRKR
ncbi:MAG: hypothetical protein J7K35_05610 [Syntrophobacterales bacterium]|nr:hypothetical protein [Syntrophobacterales bacterium]